MKGIKKRGCYWGRFNPPHKGHINLIRKLSKKVDKLFVVIGSAQKKNTQRNPFSGQERVSMLKAYLREENIKGVKVFALPDKGTYSKSVDNLLKNAPKFNILFTDKKNIINAVGKRVKVRVFSRRGAISSTKIREAILNDKKYDYLTGRSVVKLISNFKGAKRIKRAYLKK